MLKTRIILAVITAALVALLYFLPKVVVEGENEMTNNASADSLMAASNPAAHGAISEDIRRSIGSYRREFTAAGQNEKSTIFADSLWNLYTKSGQFDSAAWYAEQSASYSKTTESYLRTGDSYYEAYSFAVDVKKQREMGTKAREYLAKALAGNPKLYSAKAKMAMTLIGGDGPPMQGITMLREVVQDDPTNEFALFNLGMLSMQSQQFGRAVDWFTKLVNVNPDHLQAQVFLGVAMASNGDKAKAREQFEKVKKMTKDQSVIATIDSYLNDLK